MQRSLSETPRVFHVNWFRKDADGNSYGPAMARTCEFLKWIVDRARGSVLRFQGISVSAGTVL